MATATSVAARKRGRAVADSPYFIAVKAAHLSALVTERERCNLPVCHCCITHFENCKAAI